MPTVLITGASSGIGKAFTELFAKQQYRIILASRDEGKLNQLAAEMQQQYGTQTRIVAVDLAQQDGAKLLYERLQGTRIDILINNAGSGSFGYLHELDARSEQQMLQLNVQSLSQLMMLILPDMVRRGSGRILNVGSTTSFYPCPLSANYSASKAFVLSLTEAVARELDGTGVSITALCPGGTGTAFFQAAQMEGLKVADPKALMSPDKVAQIGYKALMRGQVVVVPGMQNWLLTQAPRLFPRRFVTRITRSVLERKR
ncbi:short-chain dehydrogenase [Paenibacillus sp. CCS19]|uniref:SDR family NAD(P)-dependent oxidoreductase n=1 Tax=Paenibacillus sp. CCS19 TaxID=3158387 RepID=UPI00256C493B|nr:SDR family oxidoreductase [Paenibacillus cellulosilyticus]GMK37778.1 short-chain dehydrogenase [Paenibacillus cellulosilyticus]